MTAMPYPPTPDPPPRFDPRRSEEQRRGLMGDVRGLILMDEEERRRLSMIRDRLNLIIFGTTRPPDGDDARPGNQ